MPSVNPVRVTTNPNAASRRVLEHLLKARPDLRTHQDLINYLFQMGDGCWDAAERAGQRLGVSLRDLARDPDTTLAPSQPRAAGPEPRGLKRGDISVVPCASRFAAARLRLFERHPRLHTNHDLVNHFLDRGRRSWSEAATRAARYGYDLDALIEDRAAAAEGRPPAPPSAFELTEPFQPAPTLSMTSPMMPREAEDESVTECEASGPADPSPQQRLLADHPEFVTNQDLVNHFLDRGRRSWEIGEALAERYGYRLVDLVRDRTARISQRGTAVSANGDAEVSQTRLGPSAAAMRRRYEGAARIKVVRSLRGVAAFQFDGKMSIRADDASRMRFAGGKPVDADAIPYIALPLTLSKLTGAKKGDLVRVEYRGRRYYAIYAEAGTEGTLGAGSMFLARKLGIDADPRAGGVEGTSVRYTVLPGSGRKYGIKNGGPEVKNANIQRLGAQAFDAAEEAGYIR